MPVSKLADVSSLLAHHFGPSKPSRGIYQRSLGQEHAFRARVCWSPAAEDDATPQDALVEIPGSAFDAIDDDARWSLLASIARLGGRATRLDIAIDYHGSALSLLEDAAASCVAGELCHARSFRLVQETTSSGVEKGTTLYLGRRGSDGCGRFVRIYDKGLQTKTTTRRDWIRYEAEFTRDLAAEALMRICKSDDHRGTARELALSAVDFRQVTGRSELHKRPRVSWWSCLNASTAKPLRTPRAQSTLLSKARWLRTSVLASLVEAGRLSGQHWTRVLEHLTGDPESVPPPCDRSSALDIAAAFRLARVPEPRVA